MDTLLCPLYNVCVCVWAVFTALVAEGNLGAERISLCFFPWKEAERMEEVREGGGRKTQGQMAGCGGRYRRKGEVLVIKWEE